MCWFRPAGSCRTGTVGLGNTIRVPGGQSGGEVRQEVAGCLGCPCAVRLPGDAGQMNTAGAVLDEDQRCDNGAAPCPRGRNRLRGCHWPRLPVPASRSGCCGGARDRSGVRQDLPDRGRCDWVAEPDQFALHPPAPTRDYRSRCGSPACGSQLPWTAAGDVGG